MVHFVSGRSLLWPTLSSSVTGKQTHQQMSGQKYILLLHVRMLFFLILQLNLSSMCSCPSPPLSFPKENYKPCRAAHTYLKHLPERGAYFCSRQQFQLPTCSVQFHFISVVAPRREQDLQVRSSIKNHPPNLCHRRLKWKKAQRSEKRPQNLKVEWDQLYWRKFSKIKFRKGQSLIPW